MKKLFFTLALLAQLVHFPVAHATDFSFTQTLQNFQESVTTESTTVDSGGTGVTLPTFTDNTTEGAGVIVSAIKRFLDFFKLIVTPVAILFITIMGVKMVTASKDNEEVTTAAKNSITYTLYGLLFIFVSDSVVNVFFGAQGEIFRTGTSGVQDFATKSSNFFAGIYGLAETLIGVISVFVLITAGMRYVAGSYDDDQIAKAKKQITWALVGLVVVGVAEYVVKDVLFPAQGTRLGVEEAKQLLANFTNFMAGTMGTVAFASLLYAGYLYVTGAQNEDNVAKAKKIITWSLIGIVIALAAFAITNTLVTLDSTR